MDFNKAVPGPINQCDSTGNCDQTSSTGFVTTNEYFQCLDRKILSIPTSGKTFDLYKK